MSQAYSKEFRRDVLAARDSGMGTRDVANRFKVSESWVRRVVQERRETGKVAPATKRNRKPAWAPYAEQLQRIVAAKPDATLAEIQVGLPRRFSRSTICVALKRLKLTLKKSVSTPPNSSVRTSRKLASSGESGKPGSTPTGSSSSTKRGRRRT
jgi:transposase